VRGGLDSRDGSATVGGGVSITVATSFPSVTAVIERAIDIRVFPGAVVEIGRAGGSITTIARGRHTYAPNTDAVTAESIYDLASLTKVLATTALMVDELNSGRMRLNDRVRQWIPTWTGEDRQLVTVQDLLEHCAGLPGHRPYWERRSGRASFEMAISEEPLAYVPRTQSIYSDPGFILLGFAVEHAAGMPLDKLFDAWRARELGASVELRFVPPAGWRDRTAPTEDRPDGAEWRGEVHDENCQALRGVAGHAGLFGTAAAVGACARWWLASASLAMFARKSQTPGSSRALGWDTMLPTSSCGTRLSSRAIGHTGFTGTSLWLDPEQDLYVALLSNRVHPTRTGDGIQETRRAVHDAVVTDLER
jgi:CubicO group peptidase (beta-lactamase class C family)